MPRPRTVRPKPVNIEWSAAFARWFTDSGQDPLEFCRSLNITRRTLDRWKNGETVPDASRRGILASLGAPPMDRAKAGPRASRLRIEDTLKEILASLKRIEAKLS